MIINKVKYKLILLFIPSLVVGYSCSESGENNKAAVPATSGFGNDNSLSVGLDKSPMDMSYYPVDYPKQKMSGEIREPLVARIIYSRPKKDGRVIFGNVVKYGSPWRLGANEATEIEFFKPVSILNKPIEKGRYIIYCIPSREKWTVILNNDLFTWGLKIDSAKDLKKFDIPVSKTNSPLEVLSMEFQKAGQGMNLVVAWDSVRAILPINY